MNIISYIHMHEALKKEVAVVFKWGKVHSRERDKVVPTNTHSAKTEASQFSPCGVLAAQVRRPQVHRSMTGKLRTREGEG